MLCLPFSPVPPHQKILETIYHLNGGNFQQIEYYLGLTIEDFMVLVGIRAEAVEAEKRALRKTR